MTAMGKFLICVVVFIGSMPASINCYAQANQLDPEKWAIELNRKDKEGNKSYRIIDSVLEHANDSTRTFDFLNKLAGNGKNDYHFHARFNCLKAHQICLIGYHKDNRVIPEVLARKAEIQGMLEFAMDQAYRSDDEYLVVLVSGLYGQLMIHFGDIGAALMYGMNSIDLSEKIGAEIKPYDYQFLGEMLFKVREYNNSIKYARKAADAWKNSGQADRDISWVACLNTVALAYHRQDKYDSALFYYDQALQRAKELNRPVWIGILSGNIAQIYYVQKRYDMAYAMFMYDYRTSKDSGYYDNAANSLQWAARTNLALDNNATALKQVREAYDLLKLWQDAGYLRNTYYTTTQIFREEGAFDSAFYYNNLYMALNDSLEKIVSRSSTDIAKARLNDEESKYRIRSLNKDKKEQILLRNIILASVVVFSFFTLLLVNRQRLKEKIKKEKAEQEKLRIEQEIASAKDQLKMFTENIVEKTNLIEKLESQIRGKEATSDQKAIIAELSQQTILTEEDWTKFKLLHEKIYPEFFINLKNRFPDITTAEQRMAALTRLQLSTKQIASMLGISVDSVHKSRQRLRQRFQVSTDANLDELVANL